METNSETKSSTPSKPLDSRVNQAKPRQALTADAARREQKILEWLQDKKFILRCEMLRWLINLEKDKGTTIDKKTVDRIVNKLQQQGQCKCMHINVPSVTNCGRSRITQVVLHQSVPRLSPELVSELHDRLRSFEIQSRSQSSYKCKNTDSVPILDGVQRTTQNNQSSDATAIKAEVMRANGFVLSKMVRAKLLHVFLWDYLRSSPGWGEKNKSYSNESCNIFELELAVKAIPLELFLQVVGSTQKFGDMVEKCKKGLCLSDLPAEEYKLVVDGHATARLSKVIDILRRLKLVRLVTNGPSDDEVKDSLTHLTHAMELKPYIEEPVSVVSTSVNGSVDLRPRIRHDFVLLNKEAVIEYWQTLEYCYSAADPRASLHAFPGSCVHEVFLFRSWSSIRVMTAEQRAKLIKCIMKENATEKLSFKKCGEIAKDLNLTLEQVLRTYCDKRHKRLDRFEDGHMVEYVRRKRKRTQKSKRFLEESSVTAARVDNENGDADAVIKSVEGQNLRVDSSGEHGAHLSVDKEDERIKTVDEMSGSSEEDETNERTRLKRFNWSYEADRQLLIQYMRHRVIRGAKFHRANWSSLQNLPAHPSTCARRMTSLKRDTKFRKAVMKLCNTLSQRYARRLLRPQNDNDHRILANCSSLEDHNVNISEQTNTCSKNDVWDDFEDKNIRRALERIIQLKHIATLEAPKRMVTASEECSDLSMDAEGHNIENIENFSGGQLTVTARRSRSRQFHQKFIKLLNEGTSITRQVHESLAVSNAIELYKLVFLSTSSAPDLPNLLAETLRRYSEHDLFAAFSYLRDKKIMIGGTGGSPFVLSQHFLHSICKSPFPSNTGKRASEFSHWLTEKQKNNVYETDINLPEDLQCGDIFHLFSLISSGEMSISPHLPNEVVGETEEFRGLKRKNEDITLSQGHSPKKTKSFTENELVCRREKGFPGIMLLSISHSRISIGSSVELLKDNKISSSRLDGSGPTRSASTKEIFDLDIIAPTGGISIVGNPGESSWQAMKDYSEYLMKNDGRKEVDFLSPDIFRAVYAAIQKAGDQGLSLNEIAQVVDVPVEKMTEYIVDVLQAFGRALKVNGYDSVRVADSLYRSKYFLASVAGYCPNMNPTSSKNSQKVTENEMVRLNSQSEVSMNVDGVHKVTILNLPEEGRNKTVEGGCMQEQEVTNANASKVYSREPSIPILPWINGDGTINKFVYNGLIRRVLGIIMQNPGMLENDIIRHMDALNPQNCRKLLQLMILDKHLITREMCQSTSAGPPALLESLLGNSFTRPEMVSRQHFFANPASSHLL